MLKCFSFLLFSKQRPQHYLAEKSSLSLFSIQASSDDLSNLKLEAFRYKAGKPFFFIEAVGVVKIRINWLDPKLKFGQL